MGNVQSESSQAASSTHNEEKSEKRLEKANNPNNNHKAKYELENGTGGAEKHAGNEAAQLKKESCLGQSKEETTDMGAKFSKSASWKVSRRWSSSVGKVSSLMTAATALQGTAKAGEKGEQAAVPIQASRSAQGSQGSMLHEGASVDPPANNSERIKQSTKHGLLNTSMKPHSQDKVKTRTFEMAPSWNPQNPMVARLPRVAHSTNASRTSAATERSTSGPTVHSQNIQKESGQSQNVNSQAACSQSVASQVSHGESQVTQSQSGKNQTAHSQSIPLVVPHSQSGSSQGAHSQSVRSQAAQSHSALRQLANSQNLQNQVAHNQIAASQAAQSNNSHSHAAHIEKSQSQTNHCESLHSHVTVSQSVHSQSNSSQNLQSNTAFNEKVHSQVGNSQNVPNHASHSMSVEGQGEKQKISLKKLKSPESLSLAKKQTQVVVSDPFVKVPGSNKVNQRPPTPLIKSSPEDVTLHPIHVEEQIKHKLLRNVHNTEETRNNQQKMNNERVGGQGDAAQRGEDPNMLASDSQTPLATESQQMPILKPSTKQETHESPKNYASVVATSGPVTDGRTNFLQQGMNSQSSSLKDGSCQVGLSAETIQQKGSVLFPSGVSYADALKQKFQQKPTQVITEQPLPVNMQSGKKKTSRNEVDDTLKKVAMTQTSSNKDYAGGAQKKEILHEQLKKKLIKEKASIKGSPLTLPKQTIHQAQSVLHESSPLKQSKSQQKAQHLLNDSSTLKQAKQQQGQHVLHETSSGIQAKQASTLAQGSMLAQAKPQQVQHHLQEASTQTQTKPQQKAQHGLQEGPTQPQAKAQPKAHQMFKGAAMLKQETQQQIQHLPHEAGNLNQGKQQQAQRQMPEASTLMQTKPQQKARHLLHQAITQTQSKMQQKPKQLPQEANILKQTAHQQVQPLVQEVSTLTQVKVPQKVQQLVHEGTPIKHVEQPQMQHQTTTISQIKQKQSLCYLKEVNTQIQSKAQHTQRHEVSTQTQANPQQAQKQLLESKQHHTKRQLTEARIPPQEKQQQKTQPLLQEVDTQTQTQVQQKAQHLLKEVNTLKQATQQQFQHLLHEASTLTQVTVQQQAQQMLHEVDPRTQATQQKAQHLLQEANTLKQATQQQVQNLLHEVNTLTQAKQHQAQQQQRFPTTTSNGSCPVPTTKVPEAQVSCNPATQSETQEGQNNKMPKIVQAMGASLQQASFAFSGAKPKFDWLGSQKVPDNHFQFNSITKEEEKKNATESTGHNDVKAPAQNGLPTAEGIAVKPVSSSTEKQPKQDKECLHCPQGLPQQSFEPIVFSKHDLKTKPSPVLLNQEKNKTLANTPTAKEPQTFSVSVTQCGVPLRMAPITTPVDLKIDVKVKDRILPQSRIQVQTQPQTLPGTKEPPGQTKTSVPPALPGKDFPKAAKPAEIQNIGEVQSLRDAIPQKKTDKPKIQDEIIKGASQAKTKSKGQSTARATSRPPPKSPGQQKWTTNPADISTQEKAKPPTQPGSKRQKKKKGKREGDATHASKEKTADENRGSSTPTTTTTQTKVEQGSEGSLEKVRPSGRWPSFRIDNSCTNKYQNTHQTERRLPENVDKWFASSKNSLIEPSWVSTLKLAGSLVAGTKFCLDYYDLQSVQGD
ncbi:protein split ends-like [Ambystoma mexicanum]|uniref:protein split ends-like n=1 Tax=Ambystoma mexicanum TaxID=8296 RepID=UPI0037E78E88